MVHHDKSSHRLDDGHGTGDDTGVVAATSSKGARCTVVLGGVLWEGYGCGGLEADPEVDVLAIGDAALDATALIGCGGKFAVFENEGIVVATAGNLRAAEAGAYLKGFGGGDREHRVAQLGFELVEHGLAQSGWNIPDDTRDRAADGILCFLCTEDALAAEKRVSDKDRHGRNRRAPYLGHQSGGVRVGTPRRMCIHAVAGDRLKKPAEVG